MKNTLNRRDFIEKSLLGAFGVSVFPHVAMGDTSKNKPEFFVSIYLEGGCSHIDSWDVKPTSKSQFAIADTKVDSIKLCEHLKDLGRHADKMVLFRGVTVPDGNHETARYLNRTSYKKIGTIVHPTLPSFYSYVRNEKLPPTAIPRNILIGSEANHPGSGWLGPKYSPLPIIDPLRGISNTLVKDETTFNRRAGILAEMNRETNKLNNPAIKAYVDFYGQTIKLLSSDDLEVFDISKESAAVRDEFGNNRFGNGMLLIKRLFEKSDVRSVEILLGGWDNHVNLYTVMDSNLQTLNKGVTALIDSLTTLGIMSKTAISINTEFGRTPVYTGDAATNLTSGRDHYPTAFSQCLISGCGIKGGSIYGKTDELGKTVIDQQISPQDYNATLATLLGLDSNKEYISPEGRPFTIANKGKVITDVLA